MIKNFFKNHRIHKKIVPYLDMFYFFNPLIFFSSWPVICVGMYLPLFLADFSPLFITDLNHRFFCLFIGLSIILCGYNINKQLAGQNISKRNVIELINNKYSEYFINNMVKCLLFMGSIFLVFVSWIHLIIGLLLIVINLFLFNSKNNFFVKNSLYHIIAESTITFLLFISGLIYICIENNLSLINSQLIINLIPYVIIYISIYLILDILNFLSDNKSNFFYKNYSMNKIIVISTTLMLSGLIVAIKLNDPLSSICIIVSLPFFLYSLLRSLKKDFQRAFVYPLFIINFFTMTIFPYLAVPSLALFYLSKYYNWHRFNYNYPTFLVEND